MFEQAEAGVCPHCDVPLTAFEKLPRSAEAVALDDDGIPVEPQHEPLRMSDMRRGKGATLLMGLAGLVLFFLPWVTVTLPDEAVYTGFELAKRLGWAWGAGCAWVVLVPTVLSRESIAQLRGARVAATFLSAIPAVTVAILFVRRPHRALVPVQIEWGWPMYATLLVSAAAILVSLRLGGRIDDLRVERGTAGGQTLH
jgi:hypothetical protein